MTKKLYTIFISLTVLFCSPLFSQTVTSTSSAVSTAATFTFTYTTSTAMAAGNIFYFTAPAGFPSFQVHGGTTNAAMDDYANYCDVYFNGSKVTASFSSIFTIAQSWTGGVQLSRRIATAAGTQITIVVKNTMTNPSTPGTYTFNWRTAQPSGAAIDAFSASYRVGATLPVIYSSVRAEAKNGNVLLTWATGTEPSNSYFVIEHSVNGLQFAPLDSVSSKGINGASYEYLCKNISAGMHVYRIRQVDKDGQSSLSASLSVSVVKESRNIESYPNPATNWLIVNFLNNKSSKEKIVVYRQSGSKIYEHVVTSGNSHTINTQFWPKDVYTLTMEDEKGEKIYTRQIIKL